MLEMLLNIVQLTPNWLKIIILSMLPVTELRGSIPFAISMQMNPWTTYVFAIFGNMIPVPILLLFFNYMEKHLFKHNILNNTYIKLIEHTRNKSSDKIEKYKELGLILFAAIPLPGTGAWTSSLIAYLFNLNFKKSFLCILLGILISGFVTTLMCLGFINILI